MTSSSSYIRKVIKTLAVSVGVFLVIAIVSFFSFRNFILRKAIERTAAKFSRDYQSQLIVEQASFKGLTTLDLRGIAIVPAGYDTLVYVGSVETNFQLLYALGGDIRLEGLSVKDGYFNVVNDDRGNNIDVFLNRKSSTNTGEKPQQADNYAKRIYKFISKILNHIPSDVSISGFHCLLNDQGRRIDFGITELSLKDELLNSTIDVETQTMRQQWHINGNANPGAKNANVTFYKNDTGKVLIPYIDERFHLVTGFDSVRLNLASVEMSGDELQIKGIASVTNFLVNHPKLSKKDVLIEKAEFNYTYLIGEHFISLDSSSEVQFNNVRFHPFISFENNPDTIIRLSIRTGLTKAQDFIASLPEGLFTHLQGMEATGDFDYSLDFMFNENQPDDMLFESNLKKHDLKIVRYGEADLDKLNGDFVYIPIEYGRPQRPILVSLETPDFTPLDQISPFLQKCVLTSEDPSFFYHRGFIDEAFRQSIIKNIRTRKFARGASTISMQLVKNVFLTREKTLSRKLEEILLVYILENNHIVSKERMLEVYFNIIEWGPNVYGIGEASRFYFKKSPSELTLKECLFLATIIPRPKGFMWRFDKQGELKPFAVRQFEFLTDKMIHRTLLMPEDTIALAEPFKITGTAKEFIKLAPDSSLMDTLPDQDDALD